MNGTVRFCITISLIILLGFSVVQAQLEDDRSFQERLESMAAENGENYLQPFVTAFGVGMNSGLFTTAKIHGILGFDVGVNMAMAMVPSDAEIYEATVPSLVGGTTTVEAPTIFGEKEGVSDSLYALPGGFGLSLVPVPMAHATIGLIMGTEIQIRMLPKMSLGDFGDLEMTGYGISHNLGQYFPAPIPLLPNLSVGFMTQSLKILDADGESLIESNHTAINVRLSKGVPPILPILTFYFGAQYETSDLTATYDFTDPILGTHQDITFELEGDNGIRFTGGMKLTMLPFISVNVDYSVGEYNSANIGLNFGVR